MKRRCVLCREQASDATIYFDLVERVARRFPRRYTLQGRLCQRHANLLFKHLKRAVPKRVFRREGDDD